MTHTRGLEQIPAQHNNCCGNRIRSIQCVTDWRQKSAPFVSCGQYENGVNTHAQNLEHNSRVVFSESDTLFNVLILQHTKYELVPAPCAARWCAFMFFVRWYTQNIKHASSLSLSVSQKSLFLGIEKMRN